MTPEELNRRDSHRPLGETGRLYRGAQVWCQICTTRMTHVFIRKDESTAERAIDRAKRKHMKEHHP